MATSVIRTLAVRLNMNSAAFRKDVNLIDRRMKKFSQSMRRQANMFNGQIAQMGLSLASAFGIREVAAAADEMQNLRNKLNAVYDSSTDVAQGMLDIKRIARESRSDLAAVGTLYQRLTVSTKSLRTSQEDVAAMTQVVANSFILSGATASEAANSARQLAQGLASGTLRGDEYRSVSENNAVLTQMLAEGFGLTVGQLRLFAMTGGITAEKIIPILTARLEETNKAIGEMKLTTQQAGVLFKNSFTEMVDRMNQAYGISDKVAKFIAVLADNVGVLTLAAGTLATVLLTRTIVSFVAWIAVGLGGAIVAVATLISSTFLLAKRLAILAVAIVAKAVPAMVAFAAKAGLVVLKFTLLFAGMMALVTGVAALAMAFGSFKDAFVSIFDYVGAKFDEFKARILRGVGNFKYIVNNLLEKLGFDSIFDVDENKVAELTKALTDAGATAEAAFNKIPAAFGDAGSEAVDNFKNIWSQIKEGLADSLPDMPNVGGMFEGEGGMMSNLKDNFVAGIDGILEKIAESNPEIKRFIDLLTGKVDDDEENVKKGEEGNKEPLPWAQRFKDAAAVAMKAMKDMSATAKAEVKTMIERYDTFEEVVAKGVENLKKHSAVRKAILLKEALIEGKAAILKAWNSAPFPANLPGVAITTASVGMAIRDIMKGQAHDGMDSLPSTGTYMLERGERVVSSRANRDLTQFLADNRNAQSMQEPTNLTLQVNGVSDPDVVVGALSQRMNELQGMMRMLSAENARANFV